MGCKGLGLKEQETGDYPLVATLNPVVIPTEDSSLRRSPCGYEDVRLGITV